jgi:NAD(P)-dependent dehydrogenase (short-subunit alcohol dehydrogenase family)
MTGQRFAGRVAVVCGASRGIGLGIAQQLGRGGARLVINARKQDELGLALESLAADGIEAVAVAGSIADDGVADKVVATAVERWGRIDHLVNNVGINPYYGPLRDVDEARFVKTMTTNTWPLITLVQAGLKYGLSERGGSVVAVTTSGTRNASTTVAIYVASKAALDSLCRSLARELGPLGVRVNAIGPGLVRTHTARMLWEGERGDLHASLVPAGRVGEPMDIGQAAAFLLSDEASWITGHVLIVDGGFLLVGGDPEIVETLSASRGPGPAS